MNIAVCQTQCLPTPLLWQRRPEASAQQSFVALRNGLYSSWPLATPTGSAVDPLDYGPAGYRLQPANVVASSGLFGDGVGEVFFNGSTASIGFATGAGGLINLHRPRSFTWSARVYLSSKTVSRPVVFVRYLGSVLQHLVYSQTLDRWQWILKVGSTTYTLTADTHGSPAAGSFTHLLAWYDATRGRIGLAVNGIPEEETDAPGAINDLVELAAIGTNGVTRFHGYMAEINFWTRLLNDKEKYALATLSEFYPFTEVATGKTPPAVPTDPSNFVAV